MSNPAPGQPSNLSNYHRPSRMTAVQVQECIDNLCTQRAVDMFGELYVARQLAWATAELERLQ